MEEKPAPEKPRPYYLPTDIEFENLPEPVRRAYDAIVTPTYTELVLGAANALERSAGMSLTFLLSLELLHQFELGTKLHSVESPDGATAGQRDKAIARYLKIFGAKQQATNFLARTKQLRNRGPQGIFIGPP